MTPTLKAIGDRVTELEKRDAVDLVHREHINKRLEDLDTKMVDIGVKMDQGFDKVRAFLWWPIGAVFLAFIGVFVKWIAGGGMAI